MITLLPFLIAFPVAIFVFTLIKSLIGKDLNNSLKDFRDEPQIAFLKPVERTFLETLELSVSGNAKIFAKVSVEDVLKVSSRQGRSKTMSVLNRISRKQVDFVICNHNDLSILGAIELEDRSNQSSTRKGRYNLLDKYLLDKYFASAQIPLLRVPMNKTYTTEQVKELLIESLILPVKEGNSGPLLQESEKPVCSRCGENMVKRMVNKGQHAGRKIWACSDFPICTEIISI